MDLRRYAFDRVFSKDSTQEEVFENTAKPVLEGLFDGFNATVFAYGVSSKKGLFRIGANGCVPTIRQQVAERPIQSAARKKTRESSTEQCENSFDVSTKVTINGKHTLPSPFSKSIMN
jgi:hypothetical protein